MISIAIVGSLICLVMILLHWHNTAKSSSVLERLRQIEQQNREWQKYTFSLQQISQEQQNASQANQLQGFKILQETLSNGMQEIRGQMNERLGEIRGELDKQLTKGLQQTNDTFNDVLKRLNVIDQAQQKITELSGNVVSLQEILVDKRARGALGEVQLEQLIINMIPKNHYSFQHTLSNGKRVDCLLMLPAPTGNVAIDAKFPLENFRLMHNQTMSVEQRKISEQQFRADIKKHIQDIANKYILANETSDAALMFIPAEAIFSDLHANYADLIELAHRERVWIVSPTTMMAILTTIQAVIKDNATRQQVHIIREHLTALGADFERFQRRMDNLAKHIQQAQQDVQEVHQSSKKISGRFQKIEKVELDAISAVTEEVFIPSEKQ